MTYQFHTSPLFWINQAQTITLTNLTNVRFEISFISFPTFEPYATDIEANASTTFTFPAGATRKYITVGSKAIPVTEGVNEYFITEDFISRPPDKWLRTSDGELVRFPGIHVTKSQMISNAGSWLGGNTQEHPLNIGCDSAIIGTLISDLDTLRRIPRYDIETLARLLACARSLEISSLIEAYIDELGRKAAPSDSRNIYCR